VGPPALIIASAAVGGPDELSAVPKEENPLMFVLTTAFKVPAWHVPLRNHPLPLSFMTVQLAAPEELV
jgi:hypothetical protein